MSSTFMECGHIRVGSIMYRGIKHIQLAKIYRVGFKQEINTLQLWPYNLNGPLKMLHQILTNKRIFQCFNDQPVPSIYRFVIAYMMMTFYEMRLSHSLIPVPKGTGW